MDAANDSEAQINQLLARAQDRLGDGYPGALVSDGAEPTLFEPRGTMRCFPSYWEDYSGDVLDEIAAAALQLLGREDLMPQLKTRVSFDDRGAFYDMHIGFGDKSISDYDVSFDSARDLASYVLASVEEAIDLVAA